MTLEENGVQNVFVVPDLVDFVSLLGTGFTSFFDGIGFNWKRLAGAKVLEIDGIDAYAYADKIASTESGNYLDHGVRVNSVFSSYRISGTDFSQRFGDIAGPQFPDRNSLTMKLIPANSTKAEVVQIPFLAMYLGAPFTDQASLCVYSVLVSLYLGADHVCVAGLQIVPQSMEQTESTLGDPV